MPLVFTRYNSVIRVCNQMNILADIMMRKLGELRSINTYICIYKSVRSLMVRVVVSVRRPYTF
jgi:hypothetical protein